MKTLAGKRVECTPIISAAINFQSRSSCTRVYMPRRVLCLFFSDSPTHSTKERIAQYSRAFSATFSYKSCQHAAISLAEAAIKLGQIDLPMSVVWKSATRDLEPAAPAMHGSISPHSWPLLRVKLDDLTRRVVRKRSARCCRVAQSCALCGPE